MDDHILQKKWEYEKLPKEERARTKKPIFQVTDPEEADNPPQKKRAKKLTSGDTNWDKACFTLFDRVALAWKEMKQHARFRAIVEKAWMRYAVEFDIAKHYEIVSESSTVPVDEAEQEDALEPEEAVYSLDGDDD